MKYHLKLRETKKNIDWFINNALTSEFDIFVSKKVFKIMKPILTRDNKYNGYKIIYV